MNNYIDRSVSEVERREWHLWLLALALLLALGSITVFTYYFILDDTYQNTNFIHTMANRAIGGLYFLIFLFCAYVIHTRIILGRLRAILVNRAIHDDLTDLYNRQYFKDRLTAEIKQAEQEKYCLAILLCNIDQFKVINDSQGYQTGDEVLRSVAKSIHESVRGTDWVSRWDGDEMVVVLGNTCREGVLVAAKRIRKGVCKIGFKTNLDLDMSIGIVFYPDHGANNDELMRMANRALFIAKKGGDKIHIGEEEYQIDEHSINIVFQAIVDVQSNHIIGYEALARDPQGKLSVLELFKRYEAIGYLNELKCFCFGLELKLAQEIGLNKIFLNVDFNMLNNIEPSPPPPGIEVILEISEAEALNDVANHLEVAGKWRKRGFKFAIDDFGAGFISLPFVSQLIPDYIKIDRSTILQSVSSDQFRVFLKDLVLAMRNYSFSGIVAEGIETEKELQVVKDMGIEYAQGFLLGMPHDLRIKQSETSAFTQTETSAFTQK